MPETVTLIDSQTLAEAARDVLSACQQLNPGLDREELLGRVHAALSCLIPGQPDAWLDVAVEAVAEQEAVL
jgi:hypothetical protein